MRQGHEGVCVLRDILPREKKNFVCVSQCSRVAVCWHWFGEWLHAWRDESRVNGLKSICGLVATACSESRMRGDNNTGTWARGNESVSACPDWLYVREILNRTIKKKKCLHSAGSGNASNRMSAKCPYRLMWDRLLISMFASGWRVSC